MDKALLQSCKVHIVGLGLMGGSLAMALRGKVAQMSAQDIQPENVHQAQARGVIEGSDGIENADIIVFAIPSDQIIGCIQGIVSSHTLKAGALLIDLGSSKTQICHAFDTLPDSLSAVGGHPMCGLAENGYAFATPTLYHKARFLLCETLRTTPQSRILAEVLARACGAIPRWIDRQRHDTLVALTSHLPHLLNFTLMRLAMEASAEYAELFELAAGGFDGATRLARTNEAMITGMFTTNAASIRAALAQFTHAVEHLQSLFDDTDRLRSELSDIVAARRAYTAAYGERVIS